MKKGNRKLCCKLVIPLSNFKSQQTNKFDTIFHEVNCASVYVNYLMECTLCKKHYVENQKVASILD